MIRAGDELSLPNLPQVYGDQENPNTTTAIMEWDSTEKARQFVQDPAMKKVMKNAKVISAIPMNGIAW